MTTIQQKIDLTIQWLQEQTKSTGCKGLVLGVSGGIDSALCAFLIKAALPINSLGVILPCESSPEDGADALEVVTKCGLEYLDIDLTNNYQQLASLITENLAKQEYKDINLHNSRANLKARLRMSTLYFIANSLNYLVVGTDNKAELYTGYFTKYGDGAADLLPLAQLTKEEVRTWALELGVPERIIHKPPSAGLQGGQTDEDELGVSYSIIDQYLKGQEISHNDQMIIERLHKISGHKRSMPPQAPKF